MTSASAPTTYPVAELFFSIQGEGVYTGTPMLFIRLAGCNVGKYTDKPLAHTPFPLFHQGDVGLVTAKQHSICTTLDGVPFTCDTDYHPRLGKLTIEEIFDGSNPGDEKVPWPPIRHICITGGEPLLHNLSPFIEWAYAREIQVHIETSGTLDIQALLCSEKYSNLIPTNVWITCCPKQGFIPRNYRVIDEWKLLYDSERSDREELLNFHRAYCADRPTYLQPINPVNSVNLSSVECLIDFLRIHPEFRLSAQLHKLLRLP